MFNPFARYHAKYLDEFRKKGIKAFVKQTYNRGRNLSEVNPPPSFLLTHYGQLNMAYEHMRAIQRDPGRKLLLLNNPADYAELSRMGQTDAGMHVYMQLAVTNVVAKMRRCVDQKTRHYISRNLGWRITAQQMIQFSLRIIFGEIYVTLHHEGQSHIVKLDEIEQLNSYVL
jgi:hypothetical protein